MIAVILERAGLDPSYLIGGDLNESGSGARHGAGDLFVFEADESDGSFLLASPSVGIVTNVEVDHVDFYPGGRGEIEAAFARVRRRGARRSWRAATTPASARRSSAPGVRASRTGRSRRTTSRSRSTRSGPTARAGASGRRRRRGRRCRCRWTAPTI